MKKKRKYHKKNENGNENEKNENFGLDKKQNYNGIYHKMTPK